MVRRIILMAVCVALMVSLTVPFEAREIADLAQTGPYAVAQVSIATTNPHTSSKLETVIYYPSIGDQVDPSGAPYATVVFAPGFLATPSSYPGNGEHLASWGYITAIPDFPSDDIEDRASDMQHLFSYLEAENTRAGSLFFDRIDTDRLAPAGHSLGGVSTLMLAARDGQEYKAAVALDPAGGPFSTWDYESEVPKITAPSAVIGAEEGGFCNSDAMYNDVYRYIGATHRAKFVIVGGSHCDFMDADDFGISVCYWLCGGQSEGREERLELIEHYTAAWFNYYVQHDTDYYTYLYGAEAQKDIQAGRISREVQTAPRDVSARGQKGAVELSWTSYSHHIIAGYNIYRSQQSGMYPSTPYAQVGRMSAYTDSAVVSGQQYFYVLRSRDAAGNEHEPSQEASAVAQDTPAFRLYVPFVIGQD